MITTLPSLSVTGFSGNASERIEKWPPALILDVDVIIFVRN
jgi:hypothetical protein